MCPTLQLLLHVGWHTLNTSQRRPLSTPQLLPSGLGDMTADTTDQIDLSQVQLLKCHWSAECLERCACTCAGLREAPTEVSLLQLAPLRAPELLIVLVIIRLIKVIVIAAIVILHYRNVNNMYCNTSFNTFDRICWRLRGFYVFLYGIYCFVWLLIGFCWFQRYVLHILWISLYWFTWFYRFWLALYICFCFLLLALLYAYTILVVLHWFY